jgi:hypothetical protein
LLKSARPFDQVKAALIAIPNHADVISDRVRLEVEVIENFKAGELTFRESANTPIPAVSIVFSGELIRSISSSSVPLSLPMDDRPSVSNYRSHRFRCL